MISRTTVQGRYPVRVLGSLVDFLDNLRRPVTESDRTTGPYPYYGANGQQGTIDQFIFDEPLILLAEDGGHFDEPQRGIAYRIRGKTWVNNHAHVIKPKSGLDLNYLYRVLENYDVRPFVTGTTRGKLTKAGASEIPIPIPPQDVQKRIAAILDAADSLRAKRRAALSDVGGLTRSIFVDLFGDPRSNPNKWPVGTLSELGKVKTGRTPPGSKSDMFGGKTPFITPGDLESGAVAKRFVTEAGAAEVETVRGGATLVCCIGATIGKMGRTSVRSAFNQQINAIEWKRRVNDDYGFAVLSFFKFRIAELGASTTLPILKKSSFEKMEIPVPSIDLQDEFARRMNLVEKTRAAQVASLSELDNLFFSIQHSVFRGEV
jgi:type I restriction enzyme, S subunit